ncbi:MAG TPA: Gfo/Idh/MocA family oxidoreductase [Bryobacteraceae bacterium]|nr:Gfo/Idh/MocA family oxidoreductase [Bryobacteraceae bacterium]
MSQINDVNRRAFLKGAVGAGATLGLANSLAAKTGVPGAGRVLGANDRINVGVIGVGGRGTYVARQFAEVGQADNSCQIVAVCDVYQKRVTENNQAHNCQGYLDYREVLNRSDIDAVIVATPDHWHGKIALEAMAKGKDVYCEKPMVHTIAEARQLVNAVKETRRVLQVGSQTTSAQQWWKAKKAISDGAIGDMLMSQGSYHRNSTEGEWNWPIDPDASPDKKGDDYIDWKTWLGPAPSRAWDPDRFFRFRKFWDYSGGIATDLFFHVAAPLNICWPEPQFPSKVMAGGGIYVFKDTREVPDTFHLIGEYKQGHSVVLTSSMANSQHIPGLIRGHKGTIIMVDHGMFEGVTDHITLKPETRVTKEDSAYTAKFGAEPIQIPIEQQNSMQAHVRNFLECMHTRQKPTLDVETAARAQVLISMAVMSYRQGRVLYFDEKTWNVVPEPPKA